MSFVLFCFIFFLNCPIDLRRYKHTHIHFGLFCESQLSQKSEEIQTCGPNVLFCKFKLSQKSEKVQTQMDILFCLVFSQSKKVDANMHKQDISNSNNHDS